MQGDINMPIDYTKQSTKRDLEDALYRYGEVPSDIEVIMMRLRVRGNVFGKVEVYDSLADMPEIPFDINIQQPEPFIAYTRDLVYTRVIKDAPKQTWIYAVPRSPKLGGIFI